MPLCQEAEVFHYTDTSDDEHARALEEQWIEGDLTAETATSEFSPSWREIEAARIADTAIASEEGLYTSTMKGLLAGFLFPMTPMFWFRELPIPNLFDAEYEAIEAERQGRSVPHPENGTEGGEVVSGGVFGTRMQVRLSQMTLEVTIS